MDNLNRLFPFHFGCSWLELDLVSFSRAQHGTQQVHFEGIAGMFGKWLK
jgi:hypothetical protein